MDKAREEAAKKRRKIASEYDGGTYQPANNSKYEERAMTGRTTKLPIEEPLDLKFVTPSTLHNYVRFKRSDVNQGVVLKFIITELAKHPSPTSRTQT